MIRHEIDPDLFACKPFSLWGKRWFLLCAGQMEQGRFNIMTVGWGSFGVMWGKPIAVVAVRPSRFTYSFMEAQSDFTLCAFPPEYQKQLGFCGSQSGRDIDKTAASGFTPLASVKVAAPGFEEADLILECKKLYFEDCDPDRFVDPTIEKNYGGTNYHRLYTGEIVMITGAEEYKA
jgi:flavin reductase (DIM6/NTAB) family NADH-FMN oxidoreductase RutF